MDILDQRVCLAVEHGVAAPGGELCERLGAVALAQTRRSDQQRILARLEELQRGEFQHRTPGQARVVGPVKVLEVLAFGQAREGEAPFQEPRTASVELVLHEAAEGLQEVHFVARHGQRARRQGRNHAREPQGA